MARSSKTVDSNYDPPRKTRFTTTSTLSISTTPSPSLSRSSSPGLGSPDVYSTTLPWWRAEIRRRLVKSVAWESRVIARMQDYIRTPWLDAYFVYTSSLGTHTFFMTALPGVFFFGFEEMGRGLIILLALGVYFSSFIKDLICSPRPFAPPVTRLTIGTHHLEYGFPSTHSTNSVSIALLLFAHIHSLSLPTTTTEPIISPHTYTLSVILLAWYIFSIVFGRLYTAMHSFTDCIVGVLLGTGIWWGHTNFPGIPITLSPSNPLFHIIPFIGLGTLITPTTLTIQIGRGLGLGSLLETWIHKGGWEVPLILIPLCLLAVNQHPQPVDDCPCFEDAIAFMSVILGSQVGKWVTTYFGWGVGMGRTVVMPGSGWVKLHGGEGWVMVERTLGDVGVWWGFAVMKMVVGVLIIFTWRILAKSLLHLILPPTYRLLARGVSLPSRRFYTPATDYKSVPSEFGGGVGGHGLRPIPSVIDLPSSGGVGVEVGGIGSGSGVGVEGRRYAGGVEGRYAGGRELRVRGVGGNGNGVYRNGKTLGVNGGGGGGSLSGMTNGSTNGYYYSEKGNDEGGQELDAVKHYDADVLTKVFVYVGIGFLACEGVPVMFELVGWGVRSWVPV
ncbi:hypothetical protein BDN72DRAFT_959047 [Pluteus cervinus]|uniref:Uncharacterized protein n=1 Tax=Pluteus cervinus TaxID=181527 RepID=A0ACD3AXQ2_9AGAR|nr:hypothetical protein BDN72DRAFT_959047 [Pluteus cervinus]